MAATPLGWAGVAAAAGDRRRHAVERPVAVGDRAGQRPAREAAGAAGQQQVGGADAAGAVGADREAGGAPRRRLGVQREGDEPRPRGRLGRRRRAGGVAHAVAPSPRWASCSAA
jgi:hypothetical protein